MQNDTITRRESVVRSYCRDFPAIFKSANGSVIKDIEGKSYIDFFAGAGALNYGHNHPALKEALLEYLSSDGILHALDMTTEAKIGFIETFERTILLPREMDYKLQFTGPTGTNAVEAALKLARLFTGRPTVISFTNAFHGVTMGSLSTTGNRKFRNASGQSFQNVTFLPYDGYVDGVYAPTYLDKLLVDSSSGLDLPAAVLVETVQGEGGVNIASSRWLVDLQDVCRRHGILLIVDDIQAGCGRTGHFFSFEKDGISPDIVTLSKSISGYGLPMSLVLLKPYLDIWEPGSHNGTFRGNNAAFVTATAALLEFWQDASFEQGMANHTRFIKEALEELSKKYDCIVDVRSKGMFGAIEMTTKWQADAVSAKSFADGLIVETCGAGGQVLKLLPPLNTPIDQLAEGFDIISNSLDSLGTGVRP